MNRSWRGRWLALSMAGSMALTGVAVGAASAADALSPRELVPLLTRRGVAPDLTIIEVIYAPPFFFEATGLHQPPEMEAQPTLAFLFQETVHDGELPPDVPEAFLLLPDGDRLEAYDAGVTAEDEHHRVSRLLFAQPPEWAADVEDQEGGAVLRLIVPAEDGTFTVSNTFEWSVPIEADGDQVADQ